MKIIHALVIIIVVRTVGFCTVAAIAATHEHWWFMLATLAGLICISHPHIKIKGE